MLGCRLLENMHGEQPPRPHLAQSLEDVSLLHGSPSTDIRVHRLQMLLDPGLCTGLEDPLQRHQSELEARLRMRRVRDKSEQREPRWSPKDWPKCRHVREVDAPESFGTGASRISDIGAEIRGGIGSFLTRLARRAKHSMEAPDPLLTIDDQMLGLRAVGERDALDRGCTRFPEDHRPAGSPVEERLEQKRDGVGPPDEAALEMGDATKVVPGEEVIG